MRRIGLLAAVLLPACDVAGDTGSEGSGDGDGWIVSDLVIDRDALNYAEVSGTVTLNRSYAGFGAKAEVRYYEDDYQTLLVKTNDYIGGDLDETGQTQSFDITHYEVYVTPALGGYETVCAEFRADDSNHGGWTKVGCL